MKACTIRDLRARTGELVRNADTGQPAIVAKHWHPFLFIAAPLDEALPHGGVRVALAIKLLQEGAMSLGRSAKLAEFNHENFVEKLSPLDIPAVDYPPAGPDTEAAAIA